MSGGGAGTLLAVPNVSEGTRAGAIEALEHAFGSATPLLDRHSDPVHDRSVFTIAGEPAALTESLLAGARKAIELVDLTDHRGEHPRIGALDVCPVVYPAPADRARAEQAALALGPALSMLGLPVFLYGEIATSKERRERHHFRRGGFEALGERMLSGELRPDYGPATPHATAGAVLLTARAPLAAFNVELEGGTLEAAREIAAALRESGGGAAGLRAIAIELGGGLIQISTNVHDPVAVRLGTVVAEIARLAAPHGARPVAAELVGLIPAAALDAYPEDVPIRDFDPARDTIEARLAAG